MNHQMSSQRFQRKRQQSVKARTFLIAFILAILASGRVLAGELPEVSDKQPVAVDHFPDRLHATVWRNWQLVEPARLAQVLGATPEQITDVATSMGLPAEVSIPAEMRDRGYITIVRRNWHLLPYEQLLQLLDISAAELAFRLREDDFLYVKLGSMKPRCDRVEYAPPGDAARKRASEIKKVVEQRFGDAFKTRPEPRFRFVDRMRRIDTDRAPVEAADSAAERANHPRFVHSYFAVYGDALSDPTLDSYPEGLLARLQDHGVNGIWLHVLLRQLAPGGAEFPEFGAGHEIRLANLRKLVDRAQRFGIDVYLYLNEPRSMPKEFFQTRETAAGVTEGDFIAMCTSAPAVRAWMSDALAHVFREVPGLGGVFTITASENLTSCASHGHQADCPRCGKRSAESLIAEVNATIAEGVHRSAPQAKVIAYDWVWSSQADANEIIKQMPAATWLMSVSEWSLPIERGGVQSRVGEYSISSVGPGPQALEHWRTAKARGMRTIAKVQLNNSWELSSVPYLPVLDLVAEHCQNLAKADVDGIMLGWSLGGYPSMNLEVAKGFAARPIPERESVLDGIARKHFGARAAPRVRQAWTKFSEAFREFPFSIVVAYHGPQQWGPANLLYARPTGYSASMIGIPYDNVEGWRSPYSAEILAAQFAKVAEGWTAGLSDLVAAQVLVPDELRADAQADLRVAQAAQLHFASAANQVRFVLARDAYLADAMGAKRDALRPSIAAIVDKEEELARKLYALAAADSRIGYEASNHYYYVPLDLVEKVVNCDFVRTQFEISGKQRSP